MPKKTSLPQKIAKYANEENEEVMNQLGTTENGLSATEAAAHLKKYGLNQIQAEEITPLQIFLRQFKSPFVYLLAAATVISFFLDQIIEGWMVILFIAINASLGFFQEYHSTKVLKLLRKLIQPQATVIRDGQEILIDSREIVPGDIIKLKTGDVIPADIRFIEEKSLEVDESVLTGESAPVTKISKPLEKKISEIYKAENLGFSGTSVVNGKALGVVLYTGSKTIVGSIAVLTAETSRVSSFEKGLKKFSFFILWLVLITLAALFAINLLIRGDGARLPELLLFSLALAVTVVPEALPVVTTFSLSRGALKLAKHKVVVKRLSAVEDLGSLQILCSDKTGTLTENKLSISNYFGHSEEKILLVANLSSSFLAEPHQDPNNSFDVALWNEIKRDKQKEIRGIKRLSEQPFDPFRRRSSVLVEENSGSTLIVRGAAEAIVPHCHLHAADKEEMNKWIVAEGRQGHRVIALAEKPMAAAEAYKTSQEESELKFIGLISFDDPLKKTAKHAVEKAKRLGIQIKILTGDGPEVAGAVAFNIGLTKSPEDVITGDDFEKLNQSQRHLAVKKYNVFARMSPQQKYDVIELLQEKAEVGYLGEGINDAPALKIANVGLVVKGAAEIAQDAADIVLLQPSLDVIVEGVEKGREIFSNTIKYIKATLSSNFGNFYAVAAASLFIDYLPMLPLQILLVNLLSDFPMISIATDSVDPEELRRPKEYNVREIAISSTVLGVTSTMFDFLFFAFFFHFQPAVVQTNWFIFSIMTELFFLYSIRTRKFLFKARRPSWPIIILTVCSTIITLSLPYLKFGKDIFQFNPPSAKELGILFILLILYLIATETIKLIFNHYLEEKDNLSTA